MAAFSCLDAAFADDKPSAATPAPGQPAVSTSDVSTSSPRIAEPGVLLGPPTAFEPGMVVDMARSLSKQPYKALSSDLPDPFKSLSNDQYAAIKLKPEARIWASESIGFVVEPLHRGFQFNMRISSSSFRSPPSRVLKGLPSVPFIVPKPISSSVGSAA